MSADAYLKISSTAQEVERSICGFRQRMIKQDHGAPASITRLRTDDAQPHWHKKTDEYYYVLSGEGKLVIDEEDVPVQAGDVIWIKPGHMHRAEGDLESLIIGIPPFDYEDVYMDPPPAAE